MKLMILLENCFLLIEEAIIYETQVISPSVEEGSFMKCGRCTKLIYPPDELINFVHLPASYLLETYVYSFHSLASAPIRAI
jgi:hypothetical protein